MSLLVTVKLGKKCDFFAALSAEYVPLRMYICGCVINLKVKVHYLHFALQFIGIVFPFCLILFFEYFNIYVSKSQNYLTVHSEKFYSILPFSFLPHNDHSVCIILLHAYFIHHINKYINTFTFPFMHKTAQFPAILCLFFFFPLNSMPWVCFTPVHNALPPSPCELPGQVSLSEGPWAVEPGPLTMGPVWPAALL